MTLVKTSWELFLVATTLSEQMTIIDDLIVIIVLLLKGY